MESFSEYIKSEHSRRKLTNPRYSLRSFAKQAGISPSHLSEIMNEQSAPSLQTINKLCVFLNTPKKQATAFIDQWNAEKSPDAHHREAAKRRLHLYQMRKYLGEDVFAFIKDWHHFAILALLETSNEPVHAKWVAQHLFLDEPTAFRALSRMKRLNMVEKTEDELYCAIPNTSFEVLDQAAPEAMQNFHSQLLKKFIQGLESTPSTERYASGSIVSVPEEGLKEIEDLLRKTAKKIDEIAAKYEHKDRVYCAGLYLTRLSKSVSSL